MPQPHEHELVCEVRKTFGGYQIEFTFDRRVFIDGEATVGAKEVWRWRNRRWKTMLLALGRYLKEKIVFRLKK